MNILIIGASGYIGRPLFKRCRSMGYHVVGTYRKNSDDGQYLKYVIGRDNIISVKNIFEKEDLEKHAVICVGESKISACKEKYDEVYKINVTATIALIKQLTESGYHIIFCSSDNVYDGEKGNYRETDAIRPVNAYGKMKAEVEQYIQRECHNVCIVRLSKVIGVPGYAQDMLEEWKSQAIRHKPVYCIRNNFFTPVYVEDVVNCIMLIMNRNLSGVYNICGNHRYSRMDLCCSFLHELGIQTDIYEKSLDEFRFNDIRPLDTSMDNRKISNETGYQFEKLENVFELYR